MVRVSGWPLGAVRHPTQPTEKKCRDELTFSQIPKSSQAREGKGWQILCGVPNRCRYLEALFVEVTRGFLGKIVPYRGKRDHRASGIVIPTTGTRSLASRFVWKRNEPVTFPLEREGVVVASGRHLRCPRFVIESESGKLTVAEFLRSAPAKFANGFFVQSIGDSSPRCIRAIQGYSGRQMPLPRERPSQL